MRSLSLSIESLQPNFFLCRISRSFVWDRWQVPINFFLKVMAIFRQKLAFFISPITGKRLIFRTCFYSFYEPLSKYIQLVHFTFCYFWTFFSTLKLWKETLPHIDALNWGKTKSRQIRPFEFGRGNMEWRLDYGIEDWLRVAEYRGRNY